MTVTCVDEQGVALMGQNSTGPPCSVTDDAREHHQPGPLHYV